MSEVGECWLGILVYMDKLHMPGIYHWFRGCIREDYMLYSLLHLIIALRISLLATDFEALPLVLVIASQYHSDSTLRKHYGSVSSYTVLIVL